MATIYPFRALRPHRDLAAQIASVPYDVVNRQEARRLADGNPASFLHVTKPEIDLADDIDPYAGEVYAQGAAALERMVGDGQLVQDAEPAIYAYELTMAGRSQVGFVLCASVDEYDRNVVRKHEHTRPDKENDRVRHMEALGAQTGTVFLVHRDAPDLDEVMAKATAGEPENDFEAADGVRHRTWVIADAGSVRNVVEGFAALGPIYIADGHHRSAAASRVAASRRETGAGPDAASQRFLAVSFPQSQVDILPYNRVIKDLAGRSADAFLGQVRAIFDVTDGKPEPIPPKSFGMFLAGRWYGLRVREHDAGDPVRSLDISILQEQLLAPVLGIQDPRRDARIDFIGGIRGDAELERRATETGGVAFSVHATALEDLFRVADAEQVMPPKSTWFEPKLRDGLFVNRI